MPRTRRNTSNGEATVTLEHFLQNRSRYRGVAEENEEEEEEEEEEDEEEERAIEYMQIDSDLELPRGIAPSEEERAKSEVDGEARDCKGDDNGESSESSQWNRTDIDGLFCPICMEAWTNEGDHRICCLPCGHLYGLSCITKWLKQSKSNAKCPQCNTKFKLKDIRKLFAPRIVVVDEESQKRIRYLEDKCDSLEKKDAVLSKKELDWKKREVELQHTIDWLGKRTIHLESVVTELQNRPSGLVTADNCDHCDHCASGNIVNSMFGSRGSSSSFVLQKELRVDGARLLDIDMSRQIILLARRLPGMAGSYVLTKLSLLPPHDSEDFLPPPGTKFIKDLHISPSNSNLALFASLGKKLSVVSTESNNVVLSYDLQVPAWSCSWNLHNVHFVYTGLQNGTLLVFDLRQFGRPLETRVGLSTNPIHTINSVIHDPSSPSGVSSVLSASSIGICEWSFGGADERPSLIPESANQGVCVSFAYCPNNDDIVASYRPRVEVPSDVAASQPMLTPCPSVGQGTMGSHLYLKRVGASYQRLGSSCAKVNNIRLPKSTIISTQDHKSYFAAGDEGTNGLTLQELPSFTAAQQFKPHKQHICDVKYASGVDGDIVGCLSEDTLQLFTKK